MENLEEKLKEARKKREEFFKPLREQDREIAKLKKGLRTEEAKIIQVEVSKINSELRELERKDTGFRDKNEELRKELLKNDSEYQKNRGDIAVLVNRRLKLEKQVKELLDIREPKIEYVFKEVDKE